MDLTQTKLVPAMLAVAAALVSLLVFVWLLAGNNGFWEVFGRAIGHVACISCLAGLVRLALPGRSRRSSVWCGLIVGGIGYLAVLGYAVMKI